MSSKEVKFGVDARDKMLRGVDILANAVRVTPVSAFCAASTSSRMR